MNINSPEWSRAKNLLIQLADVLGPLTDRVIKNTSTAIFSKRVFVPPENASVSFPYSARLLTTLETAKSEVTDLIESLPRASKEETSPGFQKKPASDAFLEKRPALTGKSLIPRALEKGDSSLNESKLNPAVSKEAFELIREVRQAIHTLSTSSNLSSPQAKTIRSAFEKLKPLIDQLIEAVSEGEMQPSNERPSHRFALPESPRKYLFKERNVTSSSNTPIKERKKEPLEKIFRASQLKEKGSSAPAPKTSNAQSKEGILPSTQKKRESEPSQFFKEGRPSSLPGRSPSVVPYYFSTLKAAHGPEIQEGEREIPPVEKTSLAAGPFTHQMRPAPDPLKKRRKRLWSRKKEDDSEKRQ
ncbi:MAG: hypothetical protein V4487_05115 [Chlamydiota bacterium]